MMVGCCTKSCHFNLLSVLVLRSVPGVDDLWGPITRKRQSTMQGEDFLSRLVEQMFKLWVGEHLVHEVFRVL
jgi:hypothetical protein